MDNNKLAGLIAKEQENIDKLKKKRADLDGVKRNTSPATRRVWGLGQSPKRGQGEYPLHMTLRSKV